MLVTVGELTTSLNARGTYTGKLITGNSLFCWYLYELNPF